MSFSDELYHYGIKGMKWGVRRYENEDGTLTEAGKKRYSKMSRAEKKRYKTAVQRRKDVRNRSELSAKELQERINKLELEKKLKNLTEEQLNPGRAATKKVLADVGKRVASSVLTGASLYAIKKLITNKGFDRNDKQNRKINWQELGNALFNAGPKKK